MHKPPSILPAHFNETAPFCPALTRFPTPLFNTHDIQGCFGGTDGNSLPLDNQRIMRTVETVLFPGTSVELIRQVSLPYIWCVKTSAYPYAGEFFADIRFLGAADASGEAPGIELPSKSAILNTMRRLTGTRYVWGGNWPEGVDLLSQYYPSRTPLEQLDPHIRETWTLKGCDCSGLLYYATGGWTPRNTSRLVHQGVPVAIEGKKREELIRSLQALDLIVWDGHVVAVLDSHTTIESKIPEGVVTCDLSGRIGQIMEEKKPVNDWMAGEGPRFVVRRWHPETVSRDVQVSPSTAMT